MSEKNRAAKLEESINIMDCFSQEGFERIGAIAKLCLMAMKTPDFWAHPDNLEHALAAIEYTANDMANCINSQAETFGCHYTGNSDDSRQRSDARWAYINQHMKYEIERKARNTKNDLNRGSAQAGLVDQEVNHG